MGFIGRLLAKTIVKGFEDIGESAGLMEYFGNQGKTPAFSDKEAVSQYKSWVYVAATKNAVATSAARLRLYATRSQGQSMPKVAPWAKVDKARQNQLKAAAPINGPVRNAEDIVEITEHPFLDLMADPNPFRSEKEFRQEVSLFADLTGNCYWMMMDGQGVRQGIPEQLWILPSQSMRIVPDKKKFIKGYIYGKQGIDGKALLPEEIVHIRRPNPGDLWYGKGRVEGMWSAIHGSEALDEFENSTARYPIPDLVLHYKDQLTSAKRREILNESNRSIMNQARSGSYLAGVFDSDAKIEKLSFPPREVVALQGRKWYRQGIVEAFGQTLSLYDTQAARATIEGAIYLWARFELDPTNQLISEKINKRVLPMYDGGDRLFCAFDPLTVEDVEMALKRDESDRRNNIRTINEIRMTRGLAESEDERADDLFPSQPMPNPSLALDDPNASPANNKDISSDLSADSNRLSGARPTFDGKAIHPDLEGVSIWLS